ncbi:MAG TPA: M50 family metallopeptidase [Candidatus Polarisedimenticolia bacterium]|nr:M50 family metallopeptidase [Candidatus Polarisedimenticolia bacterium]
MDFLINYLLPFFAMLCGLIVVHEMAHYFTAKMFGIKVLEAGLGFPPRAWGFTWRGTIYSINWLPLGGFVRLLGEEDPSDPESLAAAAAWKRLIVLGSGAVTNLILPIFLFAAVFMLPRDVPVGPAVINLVEENSPAEQAGLQPGDVILEINGEEIKNSLDAGREIRLNMGETLTFTVDRNSFGEREIIETRVKARWDPPEDQGPTGIGISNRVAGSAVCQGDGRPDQCYETEQYGFFASFPKGWDATWDSLTLAKNQVVALFKGGEGPSFAGPVGIAQATGEVVEESGWTPLLEFAALLSLNLGIINLLPIPMVDGGRVVFVLIEVARRGKRVAPEKEAIVHLVGLAFILTLAVVVTYLDVARIVTGGSLFE